MGRINYNFLRSSAPDDCIEFINYDYESNPAPTSPLPSCYLISLRIASSTTGHLTLWPLPSHSCCSEPHSTLGAIAQPSLLSTLDTLDITHVQCVSPSLAASHCYTTQSHNSHVFTVSTQPPTLSGL